MTDLLAQGINLTLFGMGTVLIFLGLLIIVTICMSAIIHRFEASSNGVLAVELIEHEPEQSLEEQHLRAVITAAIKEYKSRHV
jgi:oxaloacetate decarboxylase (Na+ extruding) subunit gamma